MFTRGARLREGGPMPPRPSGLESVVTEEMVVRGRLWSDTVLDVDRSSMAPYRFILDLVLTSPKIHKPS